MTASLSHWEMLGLVLASGVLWMNYIISKDRYQPEPGWRLLLAAMLGIGAYGLSHAGYSILEALQVPGIRIGDRAWTGFYCFGVIGPLEEGSKVLVAAPFVFRWSHYDEPIDGFVYAAAISLGFASAESLWTTSGEGWTFQVAHAIALPIAHVLFSSIWGLGISHARFCIADRRKRVWWQTGSILLAMLAHGLYDFLLFAYGAKLATSGLALMIWCVTIWRLQQLRKQAIAAREDPSSPRAG